MENNSQQSQPQPSAGVAGGESQANTGANNPMATIIADTNKVVVGYQSDFTNGNLSADEFVTQTRDAWNAAISKLD